MPTISYFVASQVQMAGGLTDRAIRPGKHPFRILALVYPQATAFRYEDWMSVKFPRIPRHPFYH